MRDMQIAMRHADPRVTGRYDMPKTNKDRHASHRVASFLAGMTWRRSTWRVAQSHGPSSNGHDGATRSLAGTRAPRHERMSQRSGGEPDRRLPHGPGRHDTGQREAPCFCDEGLGFTGLPHRVLLLQPFGRSRRVRPVRLGAPRY
jgi:hypothetical protein